MKFELKHYLSAVLLITIAIHIFLLLRLIFFPYPELFIYPYLTAKGLIPYKQILDQHFPGLMFFPVNLYTLGMRTPEVARIWHLGVVISTHVLLFLVSRKLLKSERWPLLANLLYLVWQPFFEGYVLWIDSFIPLLLLPSFYFIINWQQEKKEKYIFWAGFLLGLALLFKQVVAPLALIIFLLIPVFSKKLKPLFTFSLAFIIPVSFLIFYILRLGIWQDFFYWTVTFNLTTFAQMGRKYPQIADLVKITPVFGLAVFVWSVLLIKRKSQDLIWLGAFFFFSLAFVYARFDFIHLQPALPFAIIVLVLAFKNLPTRLLKPAAVFFVATSFVFIIPFYRATSGNRILFFGSKEKQLSAKILSRIAPGDTIFALATTPHIYQMTNTLPPGKVFVFQFPWFMVEAEERVLVGLKNDPPKMVLVDEGATTGGINLVSYMPRIGKFIRENYRVVDRIEEVKVLLPKTKQ